MQHWAPFACLAVLNCVELTSFRPRREGTTRADGGTLWLIHFLMGGGCAAAMWLHFDPAVPIAARFGSTLTALAGFLVTLAGGIVRAWAIRALGVYFTRSVQVSADQTVVETGPYRLIRHPSYSGGILEFAGVGIACGNWISLALTIVPTVVAYGLRIRVEEKALVQAVGDPYLAYMRRTKRLVPFVV
jgi:protein-S-isoprenylcysteine O-methyltransferase Ste14